MDETLIYIGLAAAAGAMALPRLLRRLDLSRAKHPSLTGHARLARRIAALVPFYAYSEEKFFASDDAPIDIAARRRAGFERLAATFRDRFPRTLRLTAEAGPAISDLQFTSAYRVPFQYRDIVHRYLPIGAFCEATTGPTITDLDGNRFFDLSGSYGVNLFGHEFYKTCIAEGAARAAALGRGAGPLPPGGRLERRAALRDLGARRSLLSHVRHRGGDAGGAPRALSHRALAPRALLRRLPWLVGRRAARRRQPAPAARNLHAARHG